MQWNVTHTIRSRRPKERREEIIGAILKTRGLLKKNQIREFLHPGRPDELTPENVGIRKTQIRKAMTRIKKAKERKEQIVVYGDYDTDGICATAILWEALYAAGMRVMPFIPHREDHGYGLSRRGIDELRKSSEVPALVITVDNGIVAHQAIKYAKKKGIDVIVCDHHERSAKLPDALAVIHTTSLAGSGVAWIFAGILAENLNEKETTTASLDLAAIGTVADMTPLVGPNRSIVKYGLERLEKTQRVGLKELMKKAQIEPADIEMYHVNFIIAPRINAMGRLEDAIDSLRLLCTKDAQRAADLAETITRVNKKRQQLTQDLLEKAKMLFESESEIAEDTIIIIDHEDFHEGIIGLIAGKMVEEFYRPTIVLSRGEKRSKASARSIPGFNIIQLIRQSQKLLVDAGGHPMAAGFTVETKKIEALKASLRKTAAEFLKPEMFEKKMSIDCAIELKDVDWPLWKDIQLLAPFGIGNPRPRFAATSCTIVDANSVGQNGEHLRLSARQGSAVVKGIAFKRGFLSPKLPSGKEVDLAFMIDRNAWRGREDLQVKIKDIRPSDPEDWSGEV